ncbi:PRA1 family protein 3 isoform X1 [Schistocerca cancellata]|uniref:PRA1 family protein 3 isoform X1 n=1 Tax=Schistocerca cancellata TaxID=274614 RepID=UPI00211913BF|nr:PRA1 family protein 3 isoform X1 [Schistocerca cancellata]
MNKKGSKMDVEIAPLRSLGDFMLESARFQIPNFRDLDKWEKRVVNNLLYYQTNYFLLGIVIFAIVGVIHPVDLFLGFLSTFGAFCLFYYFINSSASTRAFKKNYPVFGLILILVAIHFAVYLLGSMLVFLMGILLPIAVTFVHASMRLRNMKNKLVNTMEAICLKRTPMGVFLESIGKIKYIKEEAHKIQEIFPDKRQKLPLPN